MNMETISRIDALQAGFVFPSFVGRNEYIDDLRSMEGFNENAFNEPPDVLRKIFSNPNFPFSKLERRFLQREGKSPDDNLRLALFGMPEYVFPWFKAGQTLTMVFHGVAVGSEQEASVLLQVLRLRLSGVGVDWNIPIDNEEITTLVEYANNHRSEVAGGNVEWITKASNLLASIAEEEDHKNMESFDEDVLDMKPNIAGIGLNLNALLRKLKPWFKSLTKGSKGRRR